MPRLLTLAFVFLSVAAVPQDRPTIAAQPNTVFTGADGKFEAPPDTALVQFNISADASTSQAAYEQASKEAEQTRQILRDNGIDPKAAQIGYYSIQPIYDWKDDGTRGHRTLRGYSVTASVSLKLKDFTKIGPLIQQLAEANIASEGQSVGYTLDNIDEAKKKAVEDAYRHARMSAESLARASGRTLGELSYASVDTFENIRPMPMMRATPMARMQGTVPPPTEEFTPQTISVTAHVNAMFALK